MSDDKRYYFDTNVLFKHYVPNNVLKETVTEIRRLSTIATVYISNLAYLEVLGVLMRGYRQGLLINGSLKIQ